MKLVSICFFSAAIPAVADVDYGGGRAGVGTIISHTSIGSPFATENCAVGPNVNKSGLIHVLFTGSTPTNPDANTNGLPDDGQRQYPTCQTEVDPNGVVR